MIERKQEQSESRLKRKFSNHMSLVVKSVMQPLWGRRDQHVCAELHDFTLKPLTVRPVHMKPPISGSSDAYNQLHIKRRVLTVVVPHATKLQVTPTFFETMTL